MKELRIFLSSFLAFSYLILSVGIDLKAHYCHDELASLTVSFTESHCTCGDNTVEMNCCSTEETVIQFDQPCLVQQKLSAETDLFVVENEIETQDDFISEEIPISANRCETKKKESKIFLINSSLLYYG